MRGDTECELSQQLSFCENCSSDVKVMGRMFTAIYLATSKGRKKITEQLVMDSSLPVDLNAVPSCVRGLVEEMMGGLQVHGEDALSVFGEDQNSDKDEENSHANKRSQKLFENDFQGVPKHLLGISAAVVCDSSFFSQSVRRASTALSSLHEVPTDCANAAERITASYDTLVSLENDQDAFGMIVVGAAKRAQEALALRVISHAQNPILTNTTALRVAHTFVAVVTRIAKFTPQNVAAEILPRLLRDALAGAVKDAEGLFLVEMSDDDVSFEQPEDHTDDDTYNPDAAGDDMTKYPYVPTAYARDLIRVFLLSPSVVRLVKNTLGADVFRTKISSQVFKLLKPGVSVWTSTAAAEFFGTESSLSTSLLPTTVRSIIKPLLKHLGFGKDVAEALRYVCLSIGPVNSGKFIVPPLIRTLGKPDVHLKTNRGECC